MQLPLCSYKPSNHHHLPRFPLLCIMTVRYSRLPTLPRPLFLAPKKRKAKEITPFQTHHPPSNSPLPSPSWVSPHPLHHKPWLFPSPFPLRRNVSGLVRRRVQGLDVFTPVPCDAMHADLFPPRSKVGCLTNGCFFLFISANPFPTKPHYHLFLQPFSCDAAVFLFPVAQLTPHFVKLGFGS